MSDDMSNYQDLAIDIVKQACDDFRSYKRALASEYLWDYAREKLEKKLSETVWFFNSDYGDLLCFGRAKTILKKLQKEFESEEKKNGIQVS